MSNDTTNDIQAEEQPLDESGVDEVQFEEVNEQVDEAVAAAEESDEGFSLVDQLKTELTAAEKRALVAAADLENYRKRANKQIQDQVKYASLNMMNELLESVDNLNRAVEAAEKEDANSALLLGVKMVSDQILNILKSNDCEQIESVGQPFDPNQHEAIQMRPSDEFEANTVMMEIRTGYKLHERVVRPAQVFVSTGPATQG